MSFERESEQLLDLLYAAPGAPEGWARFLQAFSAFLKTTVMTYVTFDQRNDAYSVSCMSDFNPEFSKNYQDHYAALDEWYLRAKQHVSSEYVNDGRALCPTHDLMRTEFYNDFLRPYDLIHESAAVLELRSSAITALTLLRTSKLGEFSENDLRILRSFAPHIRRAVRLHHRFIDLRAGSAGQDWILNQVSFGLVILRENGSVLLANSRAQKLCNGDGLRLTRTGLHANGSRNASLEATLKTCRNPQLWPPLPNTIPIHRRNGKPLLITIGPVSPSMNLPERLTAIFIHEPVEHQSLPGHLLRNLFGLTSAEARLTTLLIKGLSIAECGENLGLTRNTIKTHTRSIYSKVGVRNQTQLVVALSRYLPL